MSLSVRSIGLSIARRMAPIAMIGALSGGCVVSVGPGRMQPESPMSEESKHGPKVADGVFIEPHMLEDGRKDLVEKCQIHTSALVTINRYLSGDSERAKLAETVKAFNILWDKQEHSPGAVNFQPLESQISPLLDSVMPKVHEFVKKSVGNNITEAIGMARSDSQYTQGSDYYLAVAKSSSQYTKGLDYYLAAAISNSQYTQGVDYYLAVAKSDSQYTQGLGYYLAAAKSDSQYTQGLDYYLAAARSRSQYTQGMDYAAQYKTKNPTAWDGLVKKHQQFEADIRRAYQDAVGKLTAENTRFNAAISGKHDAFRTDLTAAHKDFALKVQKEFIDFQAFAQGLSAPYLRKAEEVNNTNFINGTEPIDRIKGNQAKINQYDAAVTNPLIKELNAKLSVTKQVFQDAYGKLQTKYSGSYSGLQAFYTEEYKKTQAEMARGYADLQKSMLALYNGIKAEIDRFVGNNP